MSAFLVFLSGTLLTYGKAVTVSCTTKFLVDRGRKMYDDFKVLSEPLNDDIQEVMLEALKPTKAYLERYISKLPAEDYYEVDKQRLTNWLNNQFSPSRSEFLGVLSQLSEGRDLHPQLVDSMKSTMGEVAMQFVDDPNLKWFQADKLEPIFKLLQKAFLQKFFERLSDPKNAVAQTKWDLLWNEETHKKLNALRVGQTEQRAILERLEQAWSPESLQEYLDDIETTLKEVGLGIEVLQEEAAEARESHERQEALQGEIKKDTTDILSAAARIEAMLDGMDTGAPKVQTISEEYATYLKTKPAPIALVEEEVIDYLKEQSVALYRNVVNGQADVTYNPSVWDEIFKPEVLEDQKRLVQTISETNESVSLTCVESLRKAETRIWIVGVAGVGKTTTLYDIFFQTLLDPSLPTPLLFQPQELDQSAIRLLSKGKDLMGDALLLWLMNRGIVPRANYGPEYRAVQQNDDVRALVEGLKKGLRQGKYVFFLDSYDELSRMSFQVSLYGEFLSKCQNYICTSRPETYDSSDQERGSVRIDIRAPWALPTIRQFLQHRQDTLGDSWKTLYQLVTENPFTWLRNPRYLNLLITIAAAADLNEASLRALLSKGEYHLLKQLFLRSFNRLQRSGLRDLPSLEAFEAAMTQVAKGQLEAGNFRLLRTEFDKNPVVWEGVLKATELVAQPLVTHTPEGHMVRLRNHNILDYFIADDIARGLMTHEPDAPIEFPQMWTRHLLTFVSQHIQFQVHEGTYTLNQVVQRIWGALREISANNARLGEQVSSQAGFKDKMALNLLQLLISLKRATTNPSAKGDAVVEIRSRHEELKHLDLSFGNFKQVTFYECNLEGTLLSHATLKDARFEDCNLSGTRFFWSQAQNAAFVDCEFSNIQEGHHHWNNCRVKGVELTRSFYTDAAQNPLELETLIGFGAVLEGSRYASNFGKDFLKNQRKYLGKGLKVAEHHYMHEKILPYLDEIRDQHATVFLIDLMAGGNNARLENLFVGNPGLKVLAIDRDTGQLENLQTSLGDRFKALQRTIDGAIGLRSIVERSFNPTKERYANKYEDGHIQSNVHLIIGKKALHELSRDQQMALLEDCYDSLLPGGRLILFLDSPPSISEAGRTRLQELKTPVLQNQGIASIRKALIHDLEFGTTPDDVALFMNLWVFLKDWCNKNTNEVRNRYFSSKHEVLEWCSALGFQCNEADIFTENYRLTARLFNEQGLDRIGKMLNHRSSDDLTASEHRLVEEYLNGSKEHQLFYQFAERHLFKAPSSEERTPLGAHLEGERIGLSQRLREVIPKLHGLDLTNDQAATFNFSVHVVELVKP